jgi:hypothetical protein
MHLIYLLLCLAIIFNLGCSEKKANLGTNSLNPEMSSSEHNDTEGESSSSSSELDYIPFIPDPVALARFTSATTIEELRSVLKDFPTEIDIHLLHMDEPPGSVTNHYYKGPVEVTIKATGKPQLLLLSTDYNGTFEAELVGDTTTAIRVITMTNNYSPGYPYAINYNGPGSDNILEFTFTEYRYRLDANLDLNVEREVVRLIGVLPHTAKISEHPVSSYSISDTLPHYQLPNNPVNLNHFAILSLIDSNDCDVALVSGYSPETQGVPVVLNVPYHEKPLMILFLQYDSFIWDIQSDPRQQFCMALGLTYSSSEMDVLGIPSNLQSVDRTSWDGSSYFWNNDRDADSLSRLFTGQSPVMLASANNPSLLTLRFFDPDTLTQPAD